MAYSEHQSINIAILLDNGGNFTEGGLDAWLSHH
jgi:hypothetical protein